MTTDCNPAARSPVRPSSVQFEDKEIVFRTDN